MPTDRPADAYLSTPLHVIMRYYLHGPSARNTAWPLRGPLAHRCRGMGEVYRGRDTRLDLSVALKILAPTLAPALTSAHGSHGKPGPSPRSTIRTSVACTTSAASTTLTEIRRESPLDDRPVSYANFRDWQEQSAAVAEMAAMRPRSLTVSEAQQEERHAGALCLPARMRRLRSRRHCGGAKGSVSGLARPRRHV